MRTLLFLAFLASVGLPCLNAQEPPSNYHLNRYLTTVESLGAPVAIALAPNGDLWLAETLPPRIRIIPQDRLEKDDPDSHRFIDDIDLLEPSGIAIDAGGNAYVSDRANHHVIVFNSRGERQKILGTKGALAGEFCHPAGLCVAGDFLWVADAGNHRLQRIGLHSQETQGFGSFGSDLGQFKTPLSIAFDGDQTLYVADAHNHRIQRVSLEGESMAQFGDYGSDPGLLSRPVAVCFSQQEVFVCDQQNHRVVVFDPVGNYRFAFGLHAIRPSQGEGHLHYPDALAVGQDAQRLYLIESRENRIQIFEETPDPEAERLFQEQSLFGTSVATHLGRYLSFGNGLLAIDEPETHTVRLLRSLPSGEFALVHKIGRFGELPGTFNGISGLFWDPLQQRLWISDRYNRRLQVFAIDHDPDSPVKFEPFMSRFIGSLDLAKLWKEQDESKDLFAEPPSPSALALDKEGHVYVLDDRNLKILVLDSRRRLIGVFSLPSEIKRPRALSVRGEEIAVLDELPPSLYRLSTKDGSMISGERFIFPSQLAGPCRPQAITSAEDHWWVSDADGHRMLKINDEAMVLSSLGKKGLGAGEWNTPQAMISLLEDPTLATLNPRPAWVLSDYGNHRGFILDKDFEIIHGFGPRAYVSPALRPSVESNDED